MIKLPVIIFLHDTWTCTDVPAVSTTDRESSQRGGTFFWEQGHRMQNIA